MAIYHLSIKPVQRSKGRSATAAAAYRARERILDERTGEHHDYTRRHGVEEALLMTPDGSEIDRAALWNMAEAAEKRKDGTTAREYEIALPAELDAEERKNLAVEFGKAIMERHGVAVDIAIHAPAKEGDQRNFHAHIMATTRVFSEGRLREKSDFDLSDRDRKKKGLDGRKHELERIRELWADMGNRALERAKSLERITEKSLKAQGLSHAPTIHLGPGSTAIERRGERTERGDWNREAMEGRAYFLELERLTKLETGIKAARQRFEKEKRDRLQEEADRERARREKERQRQQEEERQWRLEAELREIERQHGDAVSKLISPDDPEIAHEMPEYRNFLLRIQKADAAEWEQIERELAEAEKRYEASELFWRFTLETVEQADQNTQERSFTLLMREWESATRERREEMERNALQILEEHDKRELEQRQKMGPEHGR